jgi:hypothetical protein
MAVSAVALVRKVEVVRPGDASDMTGLALQMEAHRDSI